VIKIRWNDEAIKGLKGIEFYLELESHEIARKIMDKIERKVNLLTTFPELGRIKPGKNDPKFRELVIGGYLVSYEIMSADEVEILSIRHSSRQYRHIF
jgi:plasmid stabilization system protein ParE